MREDIDTGGIGEPYAVFEKGKTPKIGQQGNEQPAAVAQDRELKPVIGKDQKGREQGVAQVGYGIEWPRIAALASTRSA